MVTLPMTMVHHNPKFYILHCISYLRSGWAHTHTHTHTHNHLWPSWILSGITQVSRHQKSKTRQVKPVWIYWSKRQWVAVASAGPCVVCILTQTHNRASIPPLSFLQARCPSCRPTNSIKALRVLYHKKHSPTHTYRGHQLFNHLLSASSILGDDDTLGTRYSVFMCTSTTVHCLLSSAEFMPDDMSSSLSK